MLILIYGCCLLRAAVVLVLAKVLSWRTRGFGGFIACRVVEPSASAPSPPPPTICAEMQKYAVCMWEPRVKRETREDRMSSDGAI
jgi:hypothetical protein